MSPGPSVLIEAASLTDVGLVRERNEDAFGEKSLAGGRLFVVADGMGGHAGGATASRLAVEAVEAALGTIPRDAPRALREALEAANRSIHDESRRDPSLRGMGTTGVALLIGSGGCWVANVGDSRAYRLRQNRFKQLTRDHSQVEELVKLGLLDREEAESHPASNVITRAVGAMDDLKIDMISGDLHDRDIYLICSDGLNKEVPDAEIGQILQSGSCEDSARALIDRALDYGARDNVTAIVVQVEEQDGSPAY